MNGNLSNCIKNPFKNITTDTRYYKNTLTCNPARADRDTALALDFPESLPALPPA